MSNAQFNLWLFGSALAAVMFGIWQHSFEAGFFVYAMIIVVRLMTFDKDYKE
jgi:hypothetical protein